MAERDETYPSHIVHLQGGVARVCARSVPSVQVRVAIQVRLFHLTQPIGTKSHEQPPFKDGRQRYRTNVGYTTAP